MPSIDLVPQVTSVAGTDKGVPRLEQPKPADDTEQKLRTLRKASSDFESILIAQLLEPLVKSVSNTAEGGQFGGGVMLSVAAEKMAESIAGKRGMGLGDVLYESLKSRILKSRVSETVPNDQGLGILQSADRKIEMLKTGPTVGLMEPKPRTD